MVYDIKFFSLAFEYCDIDYAHVQKCDVSVLSELSGTTCYSVVLESMKVCYINTVVSKFTFNKEGILQSAKKQNRNCVCDVFYTTCPFFCSINVSSEYPCIPQ